jgi:hypothetical protein
MDDPKNWGRAWKPYEQLLSASPAPSSSPNLEALYSASIRKQFGLTEPLLHLPTSTDFSMAA